MASNYKSIMKKKDHELEEDDLAYDGLIAGSGSEDDDKQSDDADEDARIQDMRQKLLTGLSGGSGD